MDKDNPNEYEQARLRKLHKLRELGVPVLLEERDWFFEFLYYLVSEELIGYDWKKEK